MRRFIGSCCLIVLTIALLVGIFFPSFGAGASILMNLSAWVVYILLFTGIFWGLVDSE